MLSDTEKSKLISEVYEATIQIPTEFECYQTIQTTEEYISRGHFGDIDTQQRDLTNKWYPKIPLKYINEYLKNSPPTNETNADRKHFFTKLKQKQKSRLKKRKLNQKTNSNNNTQQKKRRKQYNSSIHITNSIVTVPISFSNNMHPYIEDIDMESKTGISGYCYNFRLHYSPLFLYLFIL